MHQYAPPTMAELLDQFPRSGAIEWIGIRPARRAATVSVETVIVSSSGLDGDHYSGNGKRSVTLIQAEHLPVIASLAGRDSLDPALLRRNIVVSGINLLALRKKTFRIGSALLSGSGPCAPCAFMEDVLGTGGYNAMRGHGGITAQVIEGGLVSLGDAVSVVI